MGQFFVVAGLERHVRDLVDGSRILVTVLGHVLDSLLRGLDQRERRDILVRAWANGDIAWDNFFVVAG